MKVNHAGEHGAVHIYAGQLRIARYFAPALIPQLTEFQSHEATHRAVFESELKRRGISRCRTYALCALGGYTLGMLTGLLGPRAIAVTTVAVERVVLGHLRHQLDALGESDPPASAAIMAIFADEQDHHDRFASQVPRQTTFTRILDWIVAGATESVIWIGMRV